MINIKDPVDSYSAAQFCTDAFSLCDSIISKGKIPLLVGGTMMYFNALQKGLSVLPEANEYMRKQLEDEAAQLGWASLHQKLTAIDPVTAARIHAHDAQRIQRALEVYYITGNLYLLYLRSKRSIQIIVLLILLFFQSKDPGCMNELPNDLIKCWSMV